MSFKLNKSSSTKFLSSDVPGPGSYKVATEIKHEGKYISSHLKSGIDVKFSKSRRFSREKIKDLPGPGAYEPVSAFNGNGQSFISTVKSSSARSILGKINTKLKNSNSKIKQLII